MAAIINETSSVHTAGNITDVWHDAILGLCNPVTLEGEDHETLKKVDDSDTSSWRDAMDLLCRAIVIDEELEEEHAWGCIMAETQCIPAYTYPCGDSDSDDDGIAIK